MEKKFKNYVTDDMEQALDKFRLLQENYEDVRLSTLQLFGLSTRYFIQYRFKKEK